MAPLANTRLVLSLPLAGALAACAESTTSPGANVLLISLDSTRHDFSSAYGYRSLHAPGETTTPNIDRLAAEGVLFEEAYATTAWTLPSHVAILTGQPDLVHAVELEGFRIDAGLPTLAELLGEHGYRTSGFFSGPYLEPAFGFDRGFERYVACYGEDLEAASGDAARTAARLAELEGEGGEMTLERLRAWEENVAAQRKLEVASQRDVSSAAVADAAIAELEAAAGDGRPFFLFAHLFDPHFDYVPPAPFDGRFDPDYEGSIDGADFFRNRAVSTPDPSLPSGRARVLSDRDLEHVRALYAGDVAWTDEQVGRILERLDELGLAERTLVIVLADHGDEFFEHGGIGHRRTLFEEAIRVPLVMRLPGVLPAGRRVSGPVSTADVVPTALEVLDLPAPAGLSDRSLLAHSKGDEDPRPGVLSRLVRTATREIRLAGAEGIVTVPVDWIGVSEAFRRGPIKITREREWLKVPEAVEPELRATLAAESRRLFAAEALRWIDLERFPEERDADHSTAFTDPRARAALDDYRRRYAELAGRRVRAAERAERAAEVDIALRGLGYTGGGGPNEPLAADELVLPAPGEGRAGGD